MGGVIQVIDKLWDRAYKRGVSIRSLTEYEMKESVSLINDKRKKLLLQLPKPAT